MSSCLNVKITNALSKNNGCLNVSITTIKQPFNVNITKDEELNVLTNLLNTGINAMCDYAEPLLNVICDKVCGTFYTQFLFTNPTEVFFSIDGKTETIVNVSANSYWGIYAVSTHRMTTQLIQWDESYDAIVATYNGFGNGTIEFSSDLNQGIDRTKEVIVETADGAKKETITLIQEGMRERFYLKDGEFIFANQKKFNVLKDGVQQ